MLIERLQQSENQVLWTTGKKVTFSSMEKIAMELCRRQRILLSNVDFSTSSTVFRLNLRCCFLPQKTTLYFPIIFFHWKVRLFIGETT